LSHIYFVPRDIAGHAVYPIYHPLHEFDYEYGGVPLLTLPLGKEWERFFFFSAVMGKVGE
jgi:hypothetical protein